MGRPRSFDVDVALDQALQVFWQKGYEGASLTDLTEAMGINRPSLYCAFGSKEELFRKALDRYAEGPASYACRALNEPTARGVAEKLLYGAVASMCDPGTPNGCIMVQAALACSDETQRVQQELAERRAEGQEALHQRFERARAEGDLPPGCDTADLARYITTVTHGIAVQAAGGATCDELRRVIETALRAWPE